ncbi:RHS repeat-associated core domain-containing protein, partial [Flavobacterium sp.]|uniref:RHS repeat-associated core domain-containing protein n=1 Tax=Flavobacterium sp. TaxID=239 RepID=UPI00391C2994
GNVTAIFGDINGTPTNYVKRVDYDYYEQKTYMQFGNGTETYYTYNNIDRKLDNLKVKTSNGNDLYNNRYSYDFIGTIKSIHNTAPSTSNDMAGYFSHNFKYDVLNRLTIASGNFTGSNNQLALGNDASSSYDLTMDYNTTHGITSKIQKHVKNGSIAGDNTYSNNYEYYTGTHRLKNINDPNTSISEDYDYDSNGNIIKISNSQGFGKRLYWDEADRLRVLQNDRGMQHYIYDANGERTLKAASGNESVFENGTLINSTSTINGYTTYASANLVIDANGLYTKHYFMGSQRITSRLADNDASIFEICPTCKVENATPDYDPVKLQQAQIKDLNGYAEKAKMGKLVIKPYKPNIELAKEDEEPEETSMMQRPRLDYLYFYHPDHLGTSSAITDADGFAYQFFLNLPFGETMAEQRGQQYYNSPYKFNGKELDEETGLYYYGARYYDPRTSIWLSVDPEFAKFPGWSPYNYTMQNPINLIDPDGREVAKPPLKGTKEFNSFVKDIVNKNSWGGNWSYKDGTW